MARSLPDRESGIWAQSQGYELEGMAVNLDAPVANGDRLDGLLEKVGKPGTLERHLQLDGRLPVLAHTLVAAQNEVTPLPGFLEGRHFKMASDRNKAHLGRQ